MKKETIKRIRVIYGIALSISAVIAGICLIAACLSIYTSGGEQIYTAQKIAVTFAEISVPVYLCLALIVGGFILDFALPRDNRKVKPSKNYAAILERLLEKRDLESCTPELREQISAEQRSRKRDTIVSIAVLIVCSIVFLCYGANPANFHQSEINTSMVKAVAILFCCLAAPFGSALGAAYRAKASLRRQIELVKTIPAGEKKAAAPAPEQPDKGVLIARYALLCIGAALLCYGFFAGGTADVLTKAVNICTECVGLG